MQYWQPIWLAEIFNQAIQMQNKEHEAIISRLERKGFKDRTGAKLAVDADFKKLCTELRNCYQHQISNYESFQELREKFKKLSAAYCYEADICTALD